MGSITHEAVITVCGGDSNRAWVWEARLGLPVTMTLHARTPSLDVPSLSPCTGTPYCLSRDRDGDRVQQAEARRLLPPNFPCSLPAHQGARTATSLGFFQSL